MTATQPAVLALHHTLSQSKMDDRKRSLALDVDDLTPSRKRIVKDENGQQMRLDADKEKDLEVRTELHGRCISQRHPDLIQNYQKDAILRQMKEYKREKKHFEELSGELEKKLLHHDEHLRAVDAWFAQLLDEFRVLAADTLPAATTNVSSSSGESMIERHVYFSTLC